MKIMTSHENLCGKKILLRPPKERCICHGHFSFHEEARARATLFRFAPWCVCRNLGNWCRKTPGGSAARGLAARRCTGRRAIRWAFHILKLFDPIARVKPRFKTLKTNIGNPKTCCFASMFRTPLLLNWYFQVNQPAGRVFGVLQLEDSMICFMEFPCLILGWTCVAVFQQRMLQPFTKSKYVEMQEKPFAKSAKKYQVWRLGSTQWI